MLLMSLFYLHLGVVIGPADIGGGEATAAHEIDGFTAERRPVGFTPFALFDKRTRACLVEEVIVEETGRRNGDHHRVMVHRDPIVRHRAQVEAEAQRPVIDA